MTAAMLEERSSESWTVGPRWATPRTAERPTYGAVVAAVAAAMRRPPMPHQRLLYDVALEVQSEAAGDPHPGEWAYDDVTWTIERRGGKTSTITPISAHRARMIRNARIFLTAQTRDKARARWMDATDDIVQSVLRDDVRRKVSHSFEELRWRREGSLFVPFAPNEDAGHGEEGDLWWIDELWAFSAVQKAKLQQGYVPTLGTTGGQAFKMSTAGTEKSAWLNQARKDGRKAVESGVRLGTAYIEHSLPDRWNGKRLKSLSDEELVEACIDHHPAVCHVPGCPGAGGRKPCPHGFVMRAAGIRAGCRELGDRNEILRAYGNRSAADLSSRWLALDEDTWRATHDKGGIPERSPVAFGVWVDQDGEDAAVSAGWRDKSTGVMHTEHLVLTSVRDVLPYVRDRAERHGPWAVAIANVGAARDLADELETAKVPVLAVSQADVAAACSRHRTELDEARWLHLASEVATSAAAAAAWRRGRWDRPGDSISALGAQTLAGWGWDHATPPKVTKFRVR